MGELVLEGRKLHEESRALRDAEQKAIRAILTPEQQKKFDQALEQRRDRGPGRGAGGLPGPAAGGRAPGRLRVCRAAPREQPRPARSVRQPAAAGPAPRAQPAVRASLEERSGALASDAARRAARSTRRRRATRRTSARRQQRKEAKLLAEASRPLDPWERYRALVDAFEQGIDLAEMADRKVRFAMVVMASLNVGVFALTTRSELSSASGPCRCAAGSARSCSPTRSWPCTSSCRPWTRCARARRRRPARPELVARRGLAPAPPGPRAGAGRRPTTRSAWREVRFDQLHNELALQNHRLAQVNEEKYAALGRLYGGLRVLALLFAGLVRVRGCSRHVLAALLRRTLDALAAGLTRGPPAVPDDLRNARFIFRKHMILRDLCGSVALILRHTLARRTQARHLEGR